MKQLFTLCLSTILIFNSCQQQEEQTTSVVTKETKDRASHQYGGWYCPDNILGFPAVNIDSLDSVKVIIDRLPTKEETYTGQSLIYIDTLEYPHARPIDIKLPQLARFSNPYTKKDELVIVIQAIDINGDSIAGFRYANGGNGSSWLDELNFIGSDEKDALGSTAFVSKEMRMIAPKHKVWDLLTKPEYAKTLGACFGDGYYLESDWSLDAQVKFKNANNEILSTGIVTASWENMYIQVDYNFSGYHYVEKFLILENEDDNSISLHLTAGPYTSDYKAQLEVWQKWLEKIKELAEMC